MKPSPTFETRRLAEVQRIFSGVQLRLEGDIKMYRTWLDERTKQLYCERAGREWYQTLSTILAVLSVAQMCVIGWLVYKLL